MPNDPLPVEPVPAGVKPRKGNPIGQQGDYDHGYRPQPDPSGEVDED